MGMDTAGGSRMRRGCIDCRLIEPEVGTWVGARCPTCRARRGEKRGKIGRPKVRLTYWANCKQCGKRFSWLSSKPEYVRVFCSNPCHLNWERALRAKLPNQYGPLYDLYIKQNLSTTKIAEKFNTDACTVARALGRFGIPIRKRTYVVICQEPGCKERVKKVRHSISGVLYGRLCAFHRHQHLNDLSRERARKLGNIPPERWKVK